LVRIHASSSNLFQTPPFCTSQLSPSTFGLGLAGPPDLYIFAHFRSKNTPVPAFPVCKGERVYFLFPFKLLLFVQTQADFFFPIPLWSPPTPCNIKGFVPNLFFLNAFTPPLCGCYTLLFGPIAFYIPLSPQPFPTNPIVCTPSLSSSFAQSLSSDTTTPTVQAG